MKKNYIWALTYSLLLCVSVIATAGCADKINTPVSGGDAYQGEIIYFKYDGADPDPQTPQEYIMNPDGTNQRLAPGNLSQKSNVAFSSGKNVVLFESIDTSQGSSLGEAVLYASSNDGSNIDSIILLAVGATNILASPDGAYASYITTDSLGTSRLFVVLANGKGQATLISANVNENQGTAFSPDSKYIVYYSGETAPFIIETSRIDGTGSVPVCTVMADQPEPNFELSNLAWSSKGDEIAFVDYSRLYTIHPDGSNKRFIDSGAAPSWSLYGDTLAYENGGGDIVITTDLGATKINLTNTPYGETGPQWATDGKKIICLSWQGQLDDNVTTSLELIDVASKTSKTVATPAILPLVLK